MDKSVFSRRVAVFAATTLAVVIVTGAEAAVLPAVLRATAVRVCDPSGTVVVSHATSYGAVVSSVPIGALSTKTCTPAIATSSVALALTVMVAETVAPPAGAVIATVGGVEF